MMLRHHPLGGMGVCLSNKNEHCANYTSSRTKRSSVRLLGGYKAWLRGLASLAQALTRQKGDGTSLYSAAVPIYDLGQVSACKSLHYIPLHTVNLPKYQPD